MKPKFRSSSSCVYVSCNICFFFLKKIEKKMTVRSWSLFEIALQSCTVPGTQIRGTWSFALAQAGAQPCFLEKADCHLCTCFPAGDM
jgi:hypothetical protein